VVSSALTDPSTALTFPGRRLVRPSRWTTAVDCGMMTSMAFDKKNDVESAGRWLVDDIPVRISRKRALQKALNEDEAHGYELRALVPTEGFVLVVWETPKQ
jgi:hypothetical protein